MTTFYKYSGVFIVGLLIGLCLMYAATHRKSVVLPSGLVSVPSKTVIRTVRIYEKAPAEDRGAIGKDVEKDKDKELLAAGDVKTSDGKKTVAAVLDTKTGDTSLVVHQPFAEFLSRHEAGVGFGLVDGDMAKGAQYRFTFGRIWKLYGTVQIEAFQVDRMQDRNPWNAMAFVSMRF